MEKNMFLKIQILSYNSNFIIILILFELILIYMVP